MYIYVCLYVHIHIYVNIHTYLYVHMYLCPSLFRFTSPPHHLDASEDVCCMGGVVREETPQEPLRPWNAEAQGSRRNTHANKTAELGTCRAKGRRQDMNITAMQALGFGTQPHLATRTGYWTLQPNLGTQIRISCGLMARAAMHFGSRSGAPSSRDACRNRRPNSASRNC